MQIKVKLDEGAYMPERAHETDAGWDLRTPIDARVYFGCPAVIDTGVHVAIPKGFVGMVKSKSGLNVNYGILTEGVIDADYTGSIKVKLYKNEDDGQTIVFDKGQKITQLVIMPIPEIEMIQVDELENTERGNNGFGSTGK